MTKPSCVELLDGLLSLMRALEDADPGAALADAVSAATEKQAGFAPRIVVSASSILHACSSSHCTSIAAVHASAAAE
jgi:hypothetical protein